METVVNIIFALLGLSTTALIVVCVISLILLAFDRQPRSRLDRIQGRRRRQ